MTQHSQSRIIRIYNRLENAEKREHELLQQLREFGYTELFRKSIDVNEKTGLINNLIKASGFVKLYSYYLQKLCNDPRM